MYEELKMILEMLGNLGAYAVWVAVAYFVFKLMTLASYVLLAKYLVTRFFDWALEKKKTNTISIDGHLITVDGVADKLLAVLMEIKDGSDYIHSSDVSWLQSAIREKRQKDRESK